MLPEEVARALEHPENRFGEKYILVGLLGRGGMGEVWKAWEIPLSRYVALKMIKGQKVEPESLARFEREARLAARLSHPNIAAVYELDQHDGRVFIAMQYIDGESFEARERPPREATAALRDVAHALEYAHQMGVVHRDINPHNILFDRQGRAFVTDFGIARLSRGGGTVTETGMVMGTPAFMSPEQADGTSVDERTDVYSLGATLYYATTQSPPHVGDEPMKILRKLTDEDPVGVRKLNPTIDRDLETIIDTAMRKDPARRYSTMRALASDLDAYLDGRPISARPRGLLARLIHRGKRRSRLPVAGVALVVLGAIAATLFFVGVGRTRAEGRRDAALVLAAELEQLVARFEAVANPDAQRTRETQTRVEALANEILAVDPKFAYARVELARFRWAAGDRVAAYREIDRAVGAAPTNPFVHLTRARFRFKEYISLKAKRLTEASVMNLMRALGGAGEVTRDTPELLEKVRLATADLETYVKLARRQLGERGTGKAEIAFAEGVKAFYAGDLAGAAASMESARASPHFASDAGAVLAIVACLTGGYDAIEGHLARAGLRPIEEAEVRIFIGTELLARLPGPDRVPARKALVENLAHLSLLGGRLDVLDRLPPMLLGELGAILRESERRAAELRAGK